MSDSFHRKGSDTTQAFPNHATYRKQLTKRIMNIPSHWVKNEFMKSPQAGGLLFLEAAQDTTSVSPYDTQWVDVKNGLGDYCQLLMVCLLLVMSFECTFPCGLTLRAPNPFFMGAPDEANPLRCP
ncbi:unnamed protein product, partial [Choristocarpus tenellus]